MGFSFGVRVSSGRDPVGGRTKDKDTETDRSRIGVTSTSRPPVDRHRPEPRYKEPG